MKRPLKVRLFGALQRWAEGPPQSLQQRYPEYQIGAGSYGNLTVLEWGEGSTLSIGAYTAIASGVKVFLGGEHRTDWVTTFPFSVLWEAGKEIKGHPKSKGNVVIGNDVWIATEALIMSGVTIGDGAVIGARAVVTRDVPAYAIVVGNPSRIVRYRFDQQTIKRLLKIKWWEWETTRIENSMPALLSHDIESFLATVEAGNL